MARCQPVYNGPPSHRHQSSSTSPTRGYTLRVTPAMAAGVTDRPWEVSDLVALLETDERAPGLMILVFLADGLRVQQRRESRSKPNQIATFKVLGMRPGPVMSATILDISGSGMRLRSKLPAPCGASIEIGVNDTVAHGRVCRCDPKQGFYELGVQVFKTAPAPKS
jgi:PilZ domain-containing protein